MRACLVLRDATSSGSLIVLKGMLRFKNGFSKVSIALQTSPRDRGKWPRWRERNRAQETAGAHGAGVDLAHL